MELFWFDRQSSCYLCHLHVGVHCSCTCFVNFSQFYHATLDFIDDAEHASGGKSKGEPPSIEMLRNTLIV